MPDGLIFNPRNAVTGALTRQPWGEASAICKVLNRQNNDDTPPEWRASDDPQHWNYWCREALVYASDIDAILQGSGARLPRVLRLDATRSTRTLYLEDVQGRHGTELTTADYERIAAAWGRAQARLVSRPQSWQAFASHQFLRRYSSSKPVRFEVLYEREVWQHPLVRDHWPAGLQDDLIYLYEHRERLYSVLETGERVPCHLDLWPNNVFIDNAGQLVLIDWNFFGLGAWGEDIGNFVPDAVFDGFVRAAEMPTLVERMLGAYHGALCEAGIDLSMDALWRNVQASAIKYVWLGPLLLTRAQSGQHSRYGDLPLEDVADQYSQRGAALQQICTWARGVQ